MAGGAMKQPFRVLSESDAKPESFHDCHVHGLHWRRAQFTFTMDLQYILEWIKPSDDSSSYRFSVSDGRVTFLNVADLNVSMDWSGAALDAQIAVMRIVKTRTTPNGRLQRQFEIEFADPVAVISLWSTGYEVELLQAPLISDVPSIPIFEGD
jgi:hypothetical protein